MCKTTIIPDRVNRQLSNGTESGVWYGESLEHHETARAGEHVYIPAGTPHMPYNPNGKTSCVTIIARTDPNEQESIVLLPNFEAKHA